MQRNPLISHGLPWLLHSLSVKCSFQSSRSQSIRCCSWRALEGVSVGGKETDNLIGQFRKLTRLCCARRFISRSHCRPGSPNFRPRIVPSSVNSSAECWPWHYGPLRIMHLPFWRRYWRNRYCKVSWMWTKSASFVCHEEKHFAFCGYH